MSCQSIPLGGVATGVEAKHVTMVCPYATCTCGVRSESPANDDHDDDVDVLIPGVV